MVGSGRVVRAWCGGSIDVVLDLGESFYHSMVVTLAGVVSR